MGFPSVRELVSRSFDNVMSGNEEEGYRLFVEAISDRNDDPGCYPILRDVVSSMQGIDLIAMWNEYGITDYAREVFLDIPKNDLLIKLKNMLEQRRRIN